MKVIDYFNLLKSGGLVVKDNLNSENSCIEIKNLAYHTSKVTDGTLFICKGEAFRREYAVAAIEMGAVLLVSQSVPDIENVPYIAVSDIRLAMAKLSAFHYGYPSKKLVSIGITGTKGKTTTAFMLKSIIDEYEKSKMEMPCAIFSSIDNYYGGENEVSHLTTPESPDLYKYMRAAVDSKIKYLVMEASSQGLKFDRLEGMHFNIGAFLNISEDHISPREHPDFEDYFSSKMKIADISDKLIINRDSDRFDEIEKRLKGREHYTFSIEDEQADFYGYYIQSERDFTSFRVRSKKSEKDMEYRISMKGIFNVSNALCAVATAEMLGIPKGCISRGLLVARAEGRMEFFSSPDEKINVIVDYAHNRLSFEKLFESLKSEFPGKKIVAVFGCPGYKAYDRRVDLPMVAAKYCSHIYITEEDPGNEPVEDISRDIASNIPSGFPYTIENDRKAAILSALEKFKDSAVIVLTGKGRERTQRRGSEYLPCESDVDIVNSYIASYKPKLK